ncbi:MAG: glycosyltransferase [Patescibacteria group bacterium]
MVKVSIILPTYNGSKFISLAIDSVLKQNYSDWELIVINDGSTDNTAKLIQDYQRQDRRIKYLKNEKNLGIQKSLNKGLNQAAGELIARLDDDDLWLDNDKLKKQVDFLNNHPNHLLVGCGTVMVDQAGKELLRYLLPAQDAEIRERILGKNCFTHSAVLFRKESVLQLKGYSESPEVLHIEDYDLWLKLGTVGKLANLPFYGVKFMIRPTAISVTNKVHQFKKNLKLTRQYKKQYPGFVRALCRGYARLWLYGFFNLIPLAILKNKILKVYKES